MLRVVGLGVSIGRVPVIRNATFDLREGEMCGLIGRNGSGRSRSLGRSEMSVIGLTLGFNMRRFAMRLLGLTTALAGVSAVFAGAGLANAGGVAPNFMPCCTIGGQMVCCIVNASMECCKRFMS